MNMKNILENAGFTVTTKEGIVDWTKPSEIQFPFGDCVSNMDSEVYHGVCQKSLRSINYIRKTMRCITQQEFCDMIPNPTPNPMLTYLMKNIGKVRLISKGSWTKKSCGVKAGYTSNEYDFERDTEFGFADIIAMFYYSTQTNRIIFDFSRSSINRHYQQGLLRKLTGLGYVGYGTHDYEESVKAFQALRPLLDESPYLLFAVSKYDGCCISHKKYKHPIFGVHPEVTSPCLGKNIKVNESIMCELQPWLERTHISIVDDQFYLICNNHKTGETYLTRWKEDYIPNEFSNCWNL